MKLELDDIYQLDIDKEWLDWYKENKKNINLSLIKFNDIKTFYKKLNFIPIYTDGFMVWLYRNNSSGGNTIDFIRIELSGVLSFESINLKFKEYQQLILNTLKVDYKVKKLNKKQKLTLPKFIKVLRFYNNKIIQVQSGKKYSEWILFKNNKDSINLIRTKLINQTEEPVFIKTFFIPKKVIENVIEINCRSTEKEDNYVKHFGLLNKKELLLYECGIEQDELKSVKTVYFEVNGILEQYFEWLKKKNYEDSLDKVDLFHKQEVMKGIPRDEKKWHALLADIKKGNKNE